MKILTFVFLLLFLYSCKIGKRINITKNGQKQGKWIMTFTESSKIKEVTHFKNGLKNGSYKQYYEDGKIAIKGNYLKDKKNEKWIYYDAKGNKYKITLFDMDSIKSNRIYSPMDW